MPTGINVDPLLDILQSADFGARTCSPQRVESAARGRTFEPRLRLALLRVANPRSEPKTSGCTGRRGRRVNLFSFGAGILLTVMLPDNLLGALILNCWFLSVVTLASTVIHELGHILGARLVGMRAFGIEIGSGRVAYEFLLWGLRWQFRSVPLGGFAHVASKNISWYRIRESVVILGGPISTLILLGIGFIGYESERMSRPGLIGELRPWTMYI